MGKRQQRRDNGDVGYRAPGGLSVRPPWDIGPDLAGVTWKPVKCPRCGSRHCPVQRTEGEGLRRNKCLDCGLRFKSVEE